MSSADVTFSVGGVHASGTGKVHTDLEDSSHYIVACDAISGDLLSSEPVTGTTYEGGSAYQYYEVSADDSSVVLAVSSSAASCDTADLSAARAESDMDRGEEVTFDPEAKGSGDIPDDNPTVRVFRLAIRALTTPGVLGKMGRAARRKAERSFPPDRIAAEYEAYYLSVLAGEAGSGK